MHQSFARPGSVAVGSLVRKAVKSHVQLYLCLLLLRALPTLAWSNTGLESEVRYSSKTRAPYLPHWDENGLVTSSQAVVQPP